MILDTHEYFLPKHTAPISGYVSGAGTAASSAGGVGVVGASFYSRSSIGVGVLPNINVDTQCTGAGDLSIVSYEFIISTNEILKET